MTDKEMCKIRELIGRLKARQDSLGQDIRSTTTRLRHVKTDFYQGWGEGRIAEMEKRLEWNASLLAKVEQLLEVTDDA
ncbi:MAG: hypothetical protein E3J21_08635 [Anaerolineales bacterium]|nr:MAG: hypothetical protein E3J21_08635 [Anaerolineales bacterium]